MADQAKQGPEKPKIIVDDDWKAQAQAEKQKLEQQAEQAAAQELPAASFATLVSSLVAQAFMAMGGYEDPKTKRRYVDLALAKHHIDTLVVLEDKTKGNLSAEEKKLLDNALYEVRMQYVQLAQRLG
jgi:hypothetical protein